MERGPPCKICTHDQRGDIERDMIQGKADTVVAKAYGAAAQTIGKHRRLCIPQTLAKARYAEDVKHGDWIVRESRFLYSRARGVIEKSDADQDAEIKRITKGMKLADREKIIKAAEAMAGNRAEVLNAIRTAKPVLEMMAKLSGQLQEQVTINLASSPDYRALKDGLLGALKDHKPAWLDVSDFLLDFEAERTVDDDVTRSGAAH